MAYEQEPRYDYMHVIEIIYQCPHSLKRNEILWQEEKLLILVQQ